MGYQCADPEAVAEDEQIKDTPHTSFHWKSIFYLFVIFSIVIFYNSSSLNENFNSKLLTYSSFSTKKSKSLQSTTTTTTTTTSDSTADSDDTKKTTKSKSSSKSKSKSKSSKSKSSKSSVDSSSNSTHHKNNSSYFVNTHSNTTKLSHYNTTHFQHYLKNNNNNHHPINASFINRNILQSVTEDDEDSVQFTHFSDDDKKTLFTNFKQSFGKIYSNETEENHRFETFKSTLSKIDERNTAERANGGSAVHGITIFSDLSEEEFSARFLSAQPSYYLTDSTGSTTTSTSTTTSNNNNDNHNNNNNNNQNTNTNDNNSNDSSSSSSSSLEVSLSNKATSVSISPYQGDDIAVEWEGVLTRGVIDQGYCGSCWAFSVTQQMQADAIRAGLIDLNTTLSAQQLVSCDTNSYGCEGGWTERGYQYLVSVGGVTLEESYPYTSYYADPGECYDDPDSKEYDFIPYMNIDGYYTIENEQEMIDFVKTSGPLSICIDASDWLSYVKGVVSVCGSNVDHCVQITGVDTSSTDGYWRIKNTWGTLWGEGGFIRLVVGENICNIANDPTFTEPFLV